MKRMLLLALSLCCVLSFVGAPAWAADSGTLTLNAVEYYKADASNEFTRIYNLENGTIKVHMDLKNESGQAVNAVLVANVVKDGQVIASETSEAKSLAADAVGYLAVDLQVPDENCVIESYAADVADTQKSLTKKQEFKKTDNLVVADPGNQLRPLSEKASLTVNGQDVPLRREYIQGLIGGVDTPSGRDSADRYFNVAKFSMKEGDSVTIALKGLNGTRILDPLAVSPKALDIPRFVSRGVGYITINKPQNLVIRNWANGTGDGYEDIIIYVTPLETDVPYKYGSNVTYYAPGVNTCGTDPAFKENEFVYFDKGLHADVGTMNLKSGMKVYLAPGATLEAKIDTKDVENVKVYGRGILETRKAYNKGSAKGIFFNRSKNVTIEGIGVRSPYEWQTLYINCTDFTIDHMNIMGVAINNDGIDIDAVKNFTVTNNFVMCGDDGFGWHALKWEDTKTEEYPYGAPTENVFAQNNVFYNVRGGNPVRIGSSMEQDSFKNVTIKDTYVVTSETGYGFNLDIQDWAAVSDMLIENYYVEELLNSSNGAIRVEVLQGGYSNTKEGRTPPADVPSLVGSIENITFKNFQAPWKGTIEPVSVGGYDANHTVKNLVFENVVIQKGTSSYTGGQGTGPLTMEDVRFLPSTSGDQQVYVSESDVTIK